MGHMCTVETHPGSGMELWEAHDHTYAQLAKGMRYTMGINLTHSTPTCTLHSQSTRAVLFPVPTYELFKLCSDLLTSTCLIPQASQLCNAFLSGLPHSSYKNWEVLSGAPRCPKKAGGKAVERKNPGRLTVRDKDETRLTVS